MIDTDSILATIANQMKASRNKARLSQGELADLASISRRPLYLMETGKGAIRLDTFVKILDALGLEIVIKPKLPKP